MGRGKRKLAVVVVAHPDPTRLAAVLELARVSWSSAAQARASLEVVHAPMDVPWVPLVKVATVVLVISVHPRTAGCLVSFNPGAANGRAVAVVGKVKGTIGSGCITEEVSVIAGSMGLRASPRTVSTKKR